jgi:hypothetical protein
VLPPGVEPGTRLSERRGHSPLPEAGESEPEPRIGLGVHKGGRFTVGRASIAHLWHGVITRFRSGPEGSTAPYAASTPQPPFHHESLSTRGTSRTCPLPYRGSVLPLNYAGAVLTGFEPAVSTVTGWRGCLTPLQDQGSGDWGRTSVSGLTVRRPAVGRHQNEVAALCRPLPAVARDGPSWRVRDLNPRPPGYEPGEVPNSSNPL